MNRRKWLAAINVVMLVLGSLTLWYYASHQWEQRPPVWPQIDWALASISVLLAVAYALAYGYGWVLITRMMAIEVPVWMGFSIWGFSILGKYTPANVALVSYRVSAYMLHGDAKAQQVAGSLALESAMSIMAGISMLVLSVTLAGMSAFGGNATIRNAAAILVILAALAGIALLRPVKRAVLRLLRLDQAAEQITPLRIVLLLIYYVTAWVVISVSFFAMCRAFGATSLDWSQSAAIYTAAGLSGIVAIFSPSGIGVREGVMVGLLANSVPFELALAIALAARVNSLAGDLTAIAIGVAGMKVLESRDKSRVD